MARAVAELETLMRDPGLARRCRDAAEEWFSLEKGAARYDRLYRQVCQ
jgi:hypothetical protein